MSFCKNSNQQNTLNDSFSYQQQQNTQQSQQGRDLLHIENEIKQTISYITELKNSKSDTWITEYVNNSNSLISSNSEIYPKYNNQTNYYQEFWKTYLTNEMMIAKINELSTDNQELDSKLNDLENLHREYQKLICIKNKKKNRRTSSEIEKSQICPYVECSKLYGSEVSLNLHIKLKHNGGNKTERERLALSICMAQEQGKSTPYQNLNFPPGYLQYFKEQYEKKKDRLIKCEQLQNQENLQISGKNLDKEEIYNTDDEDSKVNNCTNVKQEQNLSVNKNINNQQQFKKNNKKYS